MRIPSLAVIAVIVVGVLGSPIPISHPQVWSQAILQPVRKPSASASQVTEQARLGQGRLGPLAWSPDGKILIVSSSVGLWRYQADHLELAPQLLGNGIGCGSVAFSPDGTTIASCGNQSGIGLYNASTAAETAELKLADDTICSLAFSPDGSMIAAGTRQGSVALWDVKSGTQRGRLNRQKYSVCSVTFSPDETTVAYAGSQGDVDGWDVKTNSSRLLEHPVVYTAIPSLSFSPDGANLAIADCCSSEVLNVKTGLPALHLVQFFPAPTRSIAYSPDGLLLATGSFPGIIRLYDAKTGLRRNLLRGHDDEIDNLAFSPDGKLLVSSSEDNTVRLWDVRTGTQRAVLTGFGFAVTSVAFSPNAETFVASTEGSFSTGASILQWQLGSDIHHPVPRDTIHIMPNSSISPNQANSLAFSPNGLLLASGDADSTVLWDVKTTKRATVLTRGASSVAFSPDGKLLAASGGRDVTLWQVQSGTHIATWEDSGTAADIIDVAYSPNGLLVASIETLGDVSLWNVRTGARQILTDHYRFGSSVAFSPDGLTLASSSWDSEAEIHLWDVKTGLETTTLKIQANLNVALAFSPDGTLLATGDNDGNLTLWDVKTGVARAILKGHRSAIHSLAFNTNGSVLVSGSSDGTVRLWAISASSPF